MAELTRAEAATLAGVAPDTWGAYVSRGQAPAPIRRVARTPLWDEAEVRAWAERRPGRGAPGRPRTKRAGDA